MADSPQVRAAEFLKDLPGLKEDEIARLGPCAVCGGSLLTDILFYVVTVKRAGFDPDAAQRRVGLGMALGSATLARIMGPDEDLAKVIDRPHTVAVHERCAGKIGHLLNLRKNEESSDG